MGVQEGLLIGVIVGAIGASACWLVMGLAFRETTVMHVSDLKTTRVGAMPIRMPGSSLSDVPPPGEPLHTTERCEKARNFTAWLLEKLTPIETYESLNVWWSTTSANDRRREHPGRHRRQDTPAWRKTWSKYGTQSWPTLATTGNATDIIANINPQAYFDVTEYATSSR